MPGTYKALDPIPNIICTQNQAANQNKNELKTEPGQQFLKAQFSFSRQNDQITQTLNTFAITKANVPKQVAKTQHNSKCRDATGKAVARLAETSTSWGMLDWITARKVTEP